MRESSEVELEQSAADPLSLKTPARIVGVLGMHRSGTSCLTGSLQQAGLFLGEHHTWNKHNRRGNRENQSIVDLHDAILEQNGGAWDRPPPQVSWSAQHLQRARELLHEYSAEKVFGFKDPRALLCLEGWKSLFPGIEFVGIFRHPNAVAASLNKRQEKPWEDCMELWYAHNSVLYQEYCNKPFPVLDFDTDEEVLDANITKAVDSLGLPGRDDDEKFYTPDLRNNTGAGGRMLPWRVRRLYKKLKKISL
ncbi:MAG: sulfotransferase family protein [Halioglobus sp.]|nr:sulfotransferase family protein [Halioglobus sp.]|tara:strand:- start:896 stop:1645 length:750 start_codon:yes stop_codon:yes gene_type:complete